MVYLMVFYGWFMEKKVAVATICNFQSVGIKCLSVQYVTSVHILLFFFSFFFPVIIIYGQSWKWKATWSHHIEKFSMHPYRDFKNYSMSVQVSPPSSVCRVSVQSCCYRWVTRPAAASARTSRAGPRSWRPSSGRGRGPSAATARRAADRRIVRTSLAENPGCKNGD